MYGDMTDRIAKFKLGEGEGRFLSDADPECAIALSVYWNAFGPHGSNPSKLCIDALFADVERKIAEVPS